VFGDELKTDNAAQVKIARMESGKQEPTSSELAKIATYFEVPMCSLLDDPLWCIFKGCHLDINFVDAARKLKFIFDSKEPGIIEMVTNSLRQIVAMTRTSAASASRNDKIVEMEKEVERLHEEIVALRKAIAGKQNGTTSELESVKKVI